MQETALKLWREFDRFDRTREFLPWALRIGYFEVLRFRKKQSRDRLVFSEEFLEMLADESQADPQRDDAAEALKTCLAKLDDRSREVLLARYHEDESIAALASRQEVNAHRLYRLLDQARSQVVTCGRRQLYLGDEPLAS
jgi:RNA polymerase sigma-70 factor (ECF subfamily)